MELTGVYRTTLYRNHKSGYTIFQLKPNELCSYRNVYGNVTCKGVIPLYVAGIPLSLQGDFEKTKYGYTFRADVVEEKSTDRQATIDYLMRISKGIGKKTVEQIANILGTNIFKDIDSADVITALAKIRGINEQKAVLLVEQIQKTVVQREILSFISRYGGDYTMAVSLYQAYGSSAVPELKKNPYKIGYEIGLPFSVRDWIALHNSHFQPFGEERLKHLLYEALFDAAAQGHTYITLKELKTIAKHISAKTAYPKEVPLPLFVCLLQRMRGIIVENHERLYLKSYYEAEEIIAREIKRLENGKMVFPNVKAAKAWAEKNADFPLGEDQIKALNILHSSGVKIITGGPGTGKTTTLKEIIRIYEHMYPNHKICLAAPTGRAAQRMAEATGKEATTIHRLLHYNPYEEREEQEELDGDFFIIDEMSMVDVLLFSMLLQAIPSGALVLLVGDEDQLAAVGAGNVLHDLIVSGWIETYRLTKIFRQEGTNSIIENYFKIHHSDWKFIQDDRFEIIKTDSASSSRKVLSDIISEYDKKGLFSDLQVLSTTQKYDCGTVSINKMIQSIVNGGKKGFNFGIYQYRLHDKIILTKNNYDKDYYNGDVGEVVNIGQSTVTVEINGREIELEGEELEDLQLAYAITTHKAQGSEYPIVVVLLPMNPINMLQLRLFGTAISRAKEKVIVIAEDEALNVIQSGRFAQNRNSGLAEKIDFIFKKNQKAS